MSELMKKVACSLFCAFALSSAFGQTTSTEILGTVTANQVSQGLGFNLDPSQDWEFAAAAAAGATHARFDCSWDLVEQQTAPPQNAPADPEYVQTSDCVKGYASAKKYGIHPTVVAAYGAPYHQILTVTVPGGAPIGVTSLAIEFVSGVGGDTLANIRYPYTYFSAPGAITAGTYNKLTNHGSYAGSFITGITQTDATHATIQLASATLDALPADGTQYVINEILYPSTLTESPTDPSVVEYGNYVSFLANDMASRGVTGEVEIWNEPPWLQDPWDDRGDLYDQNLWPGPQKPGPSSWIAVNFGFVGDLQNRTFPDGVTATWNGTSGNGYGSVIGPNMVPNSGVAFKQPATTVTQESFHPYGTTPEQNNWISSCLKTAAAATKYPADEPYNCLLSGETVGNAVYAAFWDAKAKLVNPTYGIGHSVTETGSLPLVTGLRIPQARFIIRQFLAFQADGITPVQFEQMYDSGNIPEPNFSFVEEAGDTGYFTANPSYTSISGFMSDINQISNQPVAAYDDSSLASVTSYTGGQYPLTSVHMVGSRPGATANSEMFSVWQRSTTPCVSGNCGVQEDWLTQASPAPAPVTVQIPSGQSVTSAINLTTREAVPYTMSGQTMSLLVADDPVGILIDPTSAKAVSKDTIPTTLTIGTSAASAIFGSTITLTAQLTPASGTVQGANGELVSFYDGQTLLGTGKLAAGKATFNASTIPIGTNEIVAQYAGDAKLGASTGFNSITVTSATPSLSFAPIGPQVYGVAPFHVVASSSSTGKVEYSVVSGPAGLSENSNSGATVGISAIGTVTLQAYQYAKGNYASATTQITFAVNPINPTLTWKAEPALSYPKDSSTYIGASSASTGPIVYSILSGPATISGTKVTFTGAGTIVVSAMQAAYGNFAATSSQFSFVVTGNTTTSLKIAAMAAQTYGAGAVTLSATSSSPAPITYSLVSGPATISGSTLKITGAGTVTVGAAQAASGSYPAATAQMIFVVNPATPTLTFSSISDQTYSTQSIALAATSTSPAALTYAVVSGPATVSGSTLKMTGTGSVTVKASQPASANYTAASTQTSFVVSALTTSLKIAQVATQTYGAGALTLSATSSSSSPAPITYSLVSGPATISGSTLKITGAGTVIIGAAQAASGSYAAATAQMTFVVNPATPTLTFSSIPDQAYSTQSIALTATSTSPAALTYAVVSGPATVSGSKLKLSGTGSVTVQVSQPATANYTAASTQTSFAVSALTTSLKIAQVAAQTYGAGALTLSATSSSSAPITYSLVSGPATISGSTLNITGAGTVVAGAAQAASGDYAAATAQMTFVVNPATPTVIFSAIPTQTYSTQPIALTATSTSPATLAYAVVSGPATVSGSTLQLSGAGSVTVQVSQPASANYTAASAQTSFLVNGPTMAQCQTLDNSNGFVATGLTLNDGASITNGVLQLTDGQTGEARSVFSTKALPVNSFTSNFTFQIPSGNEDGFTFVLQANAPTAVGLRGGGLGYAGMLKSMALKFDLHDNEGEGDDSTGIYLNGAAPKMPSLNLAPASLDLHSGHIFSVAVAYANALTTVSITDTVTGASVHWSSPGDLSGVLGTSAYAGFTAASGASATVQNILSWSFSGGSGCTVATPATGNAAQTINLKAIADTTYGAGPIALSATSTSGLPVSYTVSGPALISGNSLLIEGAGAVTVTASQTGNASYASAPTISKSFNVAPMSLVVSASNQWRAVGSSTLNEYFNVSGLVNGDPQSVIRGTATLTTTATTDSSLGNYPITFQTEGFTASNYSITYNPGVLVVQ